MLNKFYRKGRAVFLAVLALAMTQALTAPQRASAATCEDPEDYFHRTYKVLFTCRSLENVLCVDASLEPDQFGIYWITALLLVEGHPISLDHPKAPLFWSTGYFNPERIKHTPTRYRVRFDTRPRWNGVVWTRERRDLDLRQKNGKWGGRYRYRYQLTYPHEKDWNVDDKASFDYVCEPAN